MQHITPNNSNCSPRIISSSTQTHNLPSEILIEIFQYLPNHQFIQMQRLNAHYYHILRGNYFWRGRYMRLLMGGSRRDDMGRILSREDNNHVDSESAQRLPSSFTTELDASHVTSKSSLTAASSSLLRHDYYFSQYANLLEKSLWFLPANRKKRVNDYMEQLVHPNATERTNTTSLFTTLTSKDKLYAIPIYDDSDFGRITDVYYASRRHFFGWTALLLPVYLRAFVSRKWALASNLLVFISRGFTYEIYYDSQKRWKRRGTLGSLKSMLVMSMMGVFLSTCPVRWNKESSAAKKLKTFSIFFSGSDEDDGYVWDWAWEWDWYGFVSNVFSILMYIFRSILIYI